MYNEDELYAELTGSVKQAVNGVKKAIDVVNYISNMTNGKVETNLLSGTDNSFVFTGQGTDLRYFSQFNEMPVSLIENIQDENLKNAVKEEFNKAALSGKINISTKTGKITITSKGKEFINNPNFKIAAAKDYETAVKNTAQVTGFELNGTISDLSFFNHAESLELKQIMAHSDKETVQKVLSNLIEMKNKGFVQVEGGLVNITAKGKEMLKSDALKGLAKGTTTKAATAATGVGAIFIVIEEAAKLAVKAIASSPLSQK